MSHSLFLLRWVGQSKVFDSLSNLIVIISMIIVKLPP